MHQLPPKMADWHAELATFHQKKILSLNLIFLVLSWLKLNQNKCIRKLVSGSTIDEFPNKNMKKLDTEDILPPFSNVHFPG